MQRSSPLRVVRKAPPPIGLYIRAGRNDHTSIQTFLASGSGGLSGIAFDATLVDRHRELLNQALDRRVDVILDPRTQPLTTIGGYSAALGKLPWGMGRINTLADFSDTSNNRRIADQIATFAIDNRFSQVIAPTHCIADADDPWLDLDVTATFRLREALDRKRHGHVPIIYSLATSYATFRNRDKLAAIVEKLRLAAVEAVWLSVDGFGSTSTPTATLKYIEAARALHELNMPVVADHAGGLTGLALVSFGAVGGLAHGVTMGERFSTRAWRRPPSEQKFSPPHRVYLPALDMLLTRNEAELLFETGAKTRAALGCRNTTCCTRGVEDMVSKRGQHFLYQRAREVGALSNVPESIRAQRFLEEHLRPATDRALLATKLALPKELATKVINQRKRLDDLRVVLGEYSRSHIITSHSLLPLTFAARHAAR